MPSSHSRFSDVPFLRIGDKDKDGNDVISERVTVPDRVLWRARVYPPYRDRTVLIEQPVRQGNEFEGGNSNDAGRHRERRVGSRTTVNWPEPTGTPRKEGAKTMDRAEVARNLLNAAKTGVLAATDGVIMLLLMRKGARPRPGRRQAWAKGLRETLHCAQGGRCVYCGVELSLRVGVSHIDHTLPVNQGGDNGRENLQLLCPGCNVRKGDRNDPEFRHRYGSLISRRRGAVPTRPIKQSEFRRVTAGTSDAATYTRSKAGKYLTPTQKVNAGAIATGIAIGALLYLPLAEIVPPSGGDWLAMFSL